MQGFVRPASRIVGFGEVDLIAGTDLFPTREPPSYWRSVLEARCDDPISGYQHLPAEIKPVTDSLAALVESASSNAVITRWYKDDAPAREATIADARRTLHALADLRVLLDSMRARGAVTDTFVRLSAVYARLAATVYGNAFPVDARTRNPVLPNGMESAIVNVDGLTGFLVGTYEGTTADGVSLGAALSEYMEDDFGTTPLVVVIIGIAALGLAGLQLAAAQWKQAETAARAADTEARIVALSVVDDTNYYDKAQIRV